MEKIEVVTGVSWVVRVSLILLAVLLAPAARADVVEFAYEGSGWHLMTFSDYGTGLSVATTLRASGPGATGTIIFDDVGTMIVRGWGLVAGDSGSTHLNVDPVGSRSVDLNGRPPGFSGASASIGSDRGRVHVVAWAVGPEAQHKLRISTTPGHSPLPDDHQQGGDVYYVTVGDLSTAAGWEAQVSAVEAAAALPSHVDLTFASLFFGFAGLGSEGASELSLSNSTTSRDCPCEFIDHRGAGAVMPGEYRLSWEGAGIDLASPLLSGAAIPMPDFST